MLLTFGQMMKNLKLDLAGADKLKWVQALGTGLDGITDQPALKPSVTVTSLHGVHGAPVSEAALAPCWRCPATCQARSARRTSISWKRWPAKLLHGQDLRHSRHRRDRRGAGAEVQGDGHEVDRRHVGAARRSRASTACIRMANC